jgi:ribonucleoside-triphosphate reductase
MVEEKERTPCLVYSRVTGYLTPVQNWNDAKFSEYKNRVTYKINDKS